MAENEFLPNIGPDKGKILAEAVRKAKPKQVLEVGTLIGTQPSSSARSLMKKPL